MADDIDRANEVVEESASRTIAAIRTKANEMPKGDPGHCASCGSWSARLVHCHCAPCRDRFNLP